MSRTVQQNSKGSYGHEVMAVTTLALAFVFVSGFYVFLAGGGAEILMV